LGLLIIEVGESVKLKRRKKAVVFTVFIFCATAGFSKTLHVPQDYLTIKTAVAASRDGDVVEVEDGIYFEKNIIVNKDIAVRAKNLFGAVIYGTRKISECIFIVRAKAEIEGFILINSSGGIMQRDSPDVAWRAHDLAILNMDDSGISIDDRERNIGSALIENVIIDNCYVGVATNDAHDLRVRNSLVTNCKQAFQGFDHLLFLVERTVLWNCSHISRPGDWLAPPARNATNQINLGRDVLMAESLMKNHKDQEAHLFLGKFFNRPEGAAPQKAADINRRECLLDTIIGDIYLKKNDFESAKKYYQEALVRGQSSGCAEVALRALSGLARISENHGDFPAAIGYSKEAVDVIDRIVNRFPFNFFQIGYFEDKIEIFESLLNRLYLMHENEPAGGYDKEAFYYAEKLKAVGLLNGLLESASQPEDLRDADFTSRGRMLSREIARLQILLGQKNIPQEKRRPYLERLENAEDEYKAYLVRRKKQESIFSQPQPPESYRYERLRDSLLTPDSALIEYFIGNEQAFAFWLTRNSLGLARLPGPESLNSLVSNYLDFLTLESSKGFVGQKGGEKLFEILIGPFKERLNSGIKKIIIIPDGILNYLPFEALVRTATRLKDDKSGEKRSGRFLVEDYEISYAPSASCLVRLVKSRVPDTRKMELLALVNPRESFRRGVFSENVGNFPRLAFVEKEARMIGRNFDEAKRKIFGGRELTEEYFKSLDLNDFKIIHFAAHGMYDDNCWWRSAILLNSKNEENEDGLLQPFDILDLRLSADLVVLSACRSGSGRFEKGIGLMGFTNAFFLSGARSVLSSLWTINDCSTSVFMDKFYDYLRQEKTKAQALRLAKLDMLESKYSHPRFWAAFTLIGDRATPIRIGNAAR